MYLIQHVLSRAGYAGKESRASIYQPVGRRRAHLCLSGIEAVAYAAASAAYGLSIFY